MLDLLVLLTSTCTLLCPLVCYLHNLTYSKITHYSVPLCYEKQFTELGVTEDTDMEIDDLLSAAKNLTDYMRRKRPNLDMQLPIGGEVKEVFSQRDKDHMVDVKNLFILADVLFYVSLGIIVAWIGLSVFLFKKKSVKALAKTALISFGVMIGIFAVIGIFVAIDFNAAFTVFHQIFFSNDLWMLESDSVMINMLPEQFFVNTFVKGVINLSIIVGVISVICTALLILNKKAATRL